MKLFRTIALTALLMTICNAAYCQQFLWEAGFNYRFDNREYKQNPIAQSETLYGARLTPQVGLGWGAGHALMIGVDLMADFGHRSFFTDPDLVLYYKYENPKLSVYAGVFPRNNTMGDYSYAFFSDSVRFYDSNLDGLLVQYRGSRGYIEFACDWNSMYSADRREKFMLFSAARLNFGPVFVGYNMNMYHHAGSYTEKGVVDNILLYPHAGVDFTGMFGFRELYLRAGWHQAFQNDRTYVSRYVTPGGLQIEARIERWGFGIFNTVYLGDNLMPYYKSTVDGQPSYQYGLYYGETFYRTLEGIYDRLEVYWDPISKRDVKARIGFVFHYDGDTWGWQQAISLKVNISEGMFRKNHRDRSR